MALSIDNTTARSEDVWGRHKVRNVTVTFDDSYPTGGEAFAPADVGLAEFTQILISEDASGYVVQYDYTAEKLVAYGVQQDADGATSDPLDEVDDETDLSAVVVRITCIGI